MFLTSILRNHKAMKKKFPVILLVLFTGLLIFLTLNRHSKSGYGNYHSEIWADKAGYYVYLPATFIYGFNDSTYSDSITTKTGHGFVFDATTKQLQTKYNYGVALLELPFFAVAHMLAKKKDGFGPAYHKALDVAAVVYFVIAFLLLCAVFREKYSVSIVVLGILTLFAGTGLYYYVIDEVGMSHVYSFFLFALFLYSIRKLDFGLANKNFAFFALGFLALLIVIVRPTNIIFLGIIFWYNAKTWQEIKCRFRAIFMSKRLIYLFLGGFLAIVPQLIYWKIMTGEYIVYSYGNESFNWINPRIFEVLFGARNGLFTYSPLYLFLLIISVIYLRSNKIILIGFIGSFVLLTYILSCWWDPGFGCSFGARSYVEYNVLFLFPLLKLYSDYKNFGWVKRIIISLIILACIGFNMKLIYTYDNCFFGDFWDWDVYKNLLFSPTK